MSFIIFAAIFLGSHQIGTIHGLEKYPSYATCQEKLDTTVVEMTDFLKESYPQLSDKPITLKGECKAAGPDGKPIEGGNG